MMGRSLGEIAKRYGKTDADGDEPPTSVHILMTGRNRGCTHRDSMIALKVVLGRMASATSSSSGW